MNLTLAAALAGGLLGAGLWALIGAVALPFRPRLADALDLLDVLGQEVGDTGC